MTRRQEKTVSLYRSSCNFFYGHTHNEGRIGTMTTIVKRRREIMFLEIEMEGTETRWGTIEQWA
jgi:hypothetical protein